MTSLTIEYTSIARNYHITMIMPRIARRSRQNLANMERKANIEHEVKHRAADLAETKTRSSQ